MEILKSRKGSNVVGAGIAAVMLLVMAVIIGRVENGTAWNQTLSNTIGQYIEPLAILAVFAVVGFMAYSAVKGRRR